MATISYKCDTCKRHIEVLENKDGLTVMPRCNITLGCSGKLHRTSRNPDNIRETVPPIVDGLNDYARRNAFQRIVQETEDTVWTVEHRLGGSPVPVVYVNDSQFPLAKDAYSVEYVSSSLLRITLPSESSGIVDLIARTSDKVATKTMPLARELFRVSTNGIFSFAVPKLLTRFKYPPTINPDPSLPFDLSQSSGIEIEISIKMPGREEIFCFEALPVSNVGTPWAGWNEISIKKRRNFYVLSKSILSFNAFLTPDIKIEDIPNGTVLKFHRIDYGTGAKRPIGSRGLMSLLSKDPNTQADKILDKIVDIGELVGTTANELIFIDGNFYIDPEQVEDTYPNIERVL